MCCSIFKLYVVLGLCVSSSYSISVVNNITVASDFFQDRFLMEFRLGFNKSGITDSNKINDSKCVLELEEIVKKLPSLEVVPFFDSWGKLPSGLLHGHLTDLGNYDQCVKTNVILNETLGATAGQYCLASFPMQSPSQFSEQNLFSLRENPMEEQINKMSVLKVKIAVCIPDTCSQQVVTKIFRRIFETVLDGSLSNVTVSQCSIQKKPDYEAIDIFAVVLFASIGVLMILSTAYDVLITYMEKNPLQLLMAFSIVTNIRKLFLISNKKGTNSIDCLTGIRVFSMVWVLHCHNYLFYATMNLTNSFDVLIWYKRVWSMTVLMGTVSVDSFFFLSGLLIAWIGLWELDKTKGKLNVLLMYSHRYIRLTPALAATILFYVSLNKHIGSGPFRERSIMMHNNCEHNWWATLLYIQNYVNPGKMCVMQSWYLAIDTQLYVLSPLVIISLWKWGNKCVPVLIGVSLLSIGCVFATFFTQNYTSLIGFDDIDREKKIYFPTHTRYSVWIVGICTGYFMHVNRKKALQPALGLQLLGWTLSFGTMLSIIFAPYFSINYSHSTSVGHAAAYESLKHVSWGIALAWIVIACHHGFGGFVNSILSHPFWQPLGRLTYSMYLVHIAVQTINFGSVRTDEYFSDYKLILYFWSNFGISLIVAVVLALSFEVPVLVIEKSIFGTNQEKRDIKRKETSSTLCYE